MIQHTSHFIGSELLEEHPGRFTKLSIIAGSEVSDEEQLMVSDFPFIKVPGGQMSIKEWISFQCVCVQRCQLLKLAMRCGQERVENLYAHILLVILSHCSHLFLLIRVHCQKV